MTGSQLHLHTSNRVENLARSLVEVARDAPLPSLLSQETVMTLNPGIARWLQFEIAQLTGVSFGWNFPLPGKLFAQVLRGFEPDFERTGKFPEDLARWQMLNLISNLDEHERFAPIRSYCKNGDGRRRLGFANRLVRLYDEYLVYRPEDIIAWEDDPRSSFFDWQAELWRQLTRSLYPKTRPVRHIARLWHDLRSGQLLELNLQPQHWPERLFVFGVSSLAPLYLDLLDQLARYRPVHIFLLQPSDLYWADLKSSKQIQKIAKKHAQKAGSAVQKPEDWLFETGNPLLPSLGKQSQMFLDLLIDKNPQQDDHGFVPPEESASQLSCLQSDLYTIEDRDCAKGSVPFPSFDGTVQVHACSSRRREVETLWDLIVARFEADPSLKANDILVMAPDIQKYRSHIDAVFKDKRGTSLEIPYSIADRSNGNRPGVFSGIVGILKSVTQRASSAEILALLESPLLREVFSFSDQDLECIAFWIRELGITWGWGSKHRAEHGCFATDRNTWNEMRQRLLSGALFSEAVAGPGGFHAYPELEGEPAETAGRFLECLEVLRELRQASSQSHPLEHWQERMLQLLNALRCDREDWQRDYAQAGELIRECLPQSNALMANGVEVYAALAEKFESSASGGGYLSGGVTFCSLKPMRAIPANTVCLMGMNRSDFPRRSNRLSFDLLAKESRIGDRNTRDEDRQFFLETLLSVRSHLYISYQGLAQNSDSRSEPSSVVEELLSYLRNAMSPADFAQILKTQKRQSFDPSYFSDESWTYDPKRARLRNAFDGKTTLTEIAANEETEQQTEHVIATVPLEELIQFYADPSKFYATQIAQVRMQRSEEQLQEDDALFPSGLDSYRLRGLFAEAILRGRALEEISIEEAAQMKVLPAGLLEGPRFLEERAQAQTLAQALGPIETETRLIEARLDGTTLEGELSLTTGGRQLIIETGELKPKRVIAAWIRHLFASAFAPSFRGETQICTLHPKRGHQTFLDTENAAEKLQPYLDHFLSAQNAPLAFFPELSHIAAKAWIDFKGEGEAEQRGLAALAKARSELATARNGTNGAWGPKVEWSAYDSVCFGDDYDPDDHFLELALELYLPCLEASEKLALEKSQGGVL